MTELPEGKTIVINDRTYEVSLAETGMELMTGLKGVASLEPYDAMLFDFGTTMEVIMTPKGCLMPLNVAFISGAGRVEEIKTLDPNSGFTQASSMRVRYALEAPVGFFEQNGISVGDILTNL
jgi:uncharacterized membrane protein (UPF0127 family)